VSTFDDLDAFVATRRTAGLALSPDGTRLVTTVSELSADGKGYGTSLWEIDPGGARAPRRLTRSSAGESSAAFTPEGDLLFTSRRPDTTAEKPAEDRAALWLLSARGGEARPVAERPGGVSGFAVARDSGTLALVTPKPVEGDAEEQREARESAGVSARLHTHFPVRFWDHDLGPGRAHLQRCAPPDPDDPDAGYGEPEHVAPGAVPDGPAPVRSASDERLAGSAVSPDGRTLAVVTDVPDPDDPASWRRRLALHTDEGTVVVGDEPGADHESPVFTPDGRWLLWVRERHPRPGRGMAHTLRARSLADAARGIDTDVLPAETWQVRGITGAPAGDVAYVVVDEAGHAPVLRVSITDGTVTRLTRSGAYTDVVAAADGTALYALRSAVDAPPTPVRLDPHAPDQEPVALRGVTAIDPLPGALTEVTATAADGTPLRAWLVLPGGASAGTPAPLVLWIHGGPLSSWNAWSWRWNPWLMAARGWAVLLPDPRLSTGYGQEFLDPATGAWGELPYTDLMTITDATCARDDVDATRVAAMGGSFGGYMANWVAGHTDRFAAIVTHASIWHLDGFVGTTDASFHWRREWGDPLDERERYDAHSPHRHVRAIRTPMLVVHGDKDYRVPISEGLRLWYDLQRCGVESQFLYFPDENHWVLQPGDAKLWYRTVWAFLDHHVLGRPYERPALV
jgi:dipeptidyl aminopeptidase/acylaminoacyl peptidase